MLPGIGLRLVVDHEGIEVVGDVADADVDFVVQFAGAEGKLVAEVKPQDHRHVVVVDARIVVRHPVRSGDGHVVFL